MLFMCMARNASYVRWLTGAGEMPLFKKRPMPFSQPPIPPNSRSVFVNPLCLQILLRHCHVRQHANGYTCPDNWRGRYLDEKPWVFGVCLGYGTGTNSRHLA